MSTSPHYPNISVIYSPVSSFAAENQYWRPPVQNIWELKSKLTAGIFWSSLNLAIHLSSIGDTFTTFHLVEWIVEYELWYTLLKNNTGLFGNFSQHGRMGGLPKSHLEKPISNDPVFFPACVPKQPHDSAVVFLVMKNYLHFPLCDKQSNNGAAAVSNQKGILMGLELL